MKGYPKWFNATLVHTICGFAFLSGLLLLPTTLEMILSLPVVWRLPSDQHTWVSALHLLFGCLLLVLLGALWSIHMRVGWRKKRKRISGTLVSTLIAILGITGIGVLYLSAEGVANGNSLFHAGLGLLFLPLYSVHLLIKINR